MLFFNKIVELKNKEGIKEEFTKMSINAISSVSLYEYYFTINKDKEEKKSPIADELEKYNIESTGNEKLDIIALEKAKQAEYNNKQVSGKEELKSERPWADIMYQLNLSFNDDPADDIQDIKDELQDLLTGIKDKELENEIRDLENYVENAYISYSKNNSSSLLTAQLNNFSNINIVGIS